MVSPFSRNAYGGVDEQVARSAHPRAGRRIPAAPGQLAPELDSEGWLRERVPAEAKVCQLTLWPGEYPDGESLEWSIDLVEKLQEVQGT